MIKRIFFIFFILQPLIFIGNHADDLREAVLCKKCSANERTQKIVKITEAIREKDANNIINLSDSLSKVLDPKDALQRYLKLVKAVSLRKKRKGEEAIALLKTIDPGNDEDLKYYIDYHLARMYIVASDYNNALGYLLKNLDYYEKVKKDKKQQVLILGSISNCYRRMKMFDQCLVYVNKCIKVSNETKDTLNMFDAYSALAIFYLEKGEYEKADSCYGAIEKIVGNLKSKAKESFYNNYAEACINLNNLEKGEKLINECFRIATTEKDTFWIAIALVNKGNIEIKKGRFANALKMCKTGLGYFEEFRSLVWQKNSCQCLFEGNLGIKNYKEALEYYQKVNSIKDSILSESNHREMTRKEIQFEYEKKEAEAKLSAKLEKEKEELKAMEEKKISNLILYSVIAGLLLVSVFSVLIFRSLQKNKNANKIISAQKVLVEEKQKEVMDSIEYASRIQKALLTSEKYIDKALNRLKRS